VVASWSWTTKRGTRRTQSGSAGQPAQEPAKLLDRSDGDGAEDDGAVRSAFLNELDARHVIQSGRRT
jgi:hypothetical protein